MTRAVLRKELAVLWASPIPYVVGALFHLTAGLLYVNQLQGRSQAVLQPLFPLAGFLLLLLAPLIAMRSFAEESRTGTLDLLLAVPVRARPLVVGKWLACWITTVVVVAPAAVFVLLLALWAEPDFGPAITGFLGLALLAAAVSGVGIAASALSSSQPVAAVVAFIVGLLLWFSYAGSGTVSLGGLLLRLSLSERLRGFAGGAIDTADAGYFVVLAAASLVVAAIAVGGRRLR